MVSQITAFFRCHPIKPALRQADFAATCSQKCAQPACDRFEATAWRVRIACSYRQILGSKASWRLRRAPFLSIYPDRHPCKTAEGQEASF